MNSNDSWNRSMPGYAPVTLEQDDDAQSDTEEMLTVVPVGDEQIEEDDSFSLDKFQVVRREFFSHISEPSITFNNYKIGLNSACIKRLPQIDYIQFLVNRQTGSWLSGHVSNRICILFSGVPTVAANASRVR